LARGGEYALPRSSSIEVALNFGDIDC